MSTENTPARNANMGFQLLSKEERQLQAKIRNTYFFFNFLPMWIGSYTALKYLTHKGRIKLKRPILAYTGLTLFTYTTSKIFEIRKLTKEMREKFPEGLYAQTSHMNRAQVMEYIKEKDLENAKKKLEAAGMSVGDQTAQVPDQQEQINTDPLDVGQQQDSTKEQPAPRKTYDDLRKHNIRAGSPNTTSTRPLPEKESLSDDDAPSKLRTGKRNKYGDEIE